MYSICNNTDQKDLLKFWVSELTHLSPNEVEEIVMTLNQQKPNLESAT